MQKANSAMQTEKFCLDSETHVEGDDFVDSDTITADLEAALAESRRRKQDKTLSMRTTILTEDGRRIGPAMMTAQEAQDCLAAQREHERTILSEMLRWMGRLPSSDAETDRAFRSAKTRRSAAGKVTGQFSKAFRPDAPRHRPSVCPPSTNHVCPVTYDAASDARKTTALASSSGLPSLPSGIFSSACRRASSKEMPAASALR